MIKARIGLEIHVQIASVKTKLFCSCPAGPRVEAPNSNVCPVCLGLPGALPVVNEKAVVCGLAVAMALNAEIPSELVFSRKHYFYPDLPKSYQITQFQGYGAPIGRNGKLVIKANGTLKEVRIARINLEEDPGRTVYPEGDIMTSRVALVDYNRSGVPLLEIVTAPDLESPREAELFLDKLRVILEYLGVVDPRREGWMRVDANISVEGGARVEVKNLGSIKDVRKALEYELLRQGKIVAGGGGVVRETRHWDPVRGVTLPLREKEFEEDYRYFPDPDLPPIPVTEQLVESAKALIPELPDEKAARFMSEYGLAEHVASVLVMNKHVAELFEEAVKLHRNPSRIASILVTDYLSCLDRHGLRPGEDRLTAHHLAKLVRLVDEGVITVVAAKEVLWSMILKGVDPLSEAKRRGFVGRITGDELAELVRRVLEEHPKAVSDAIRNPQAINFLVGAVLKRTRGRADPKEAYRMIKDALEKARGSARGHEA